MVSHTKVCRAFVRYAESDLLLMVVHIPTFMNNLYVCHLQRFFLSADLWLHRILAESETPGVVARMYIILKFLRWLSRSARCGNHWSKRVICSHNKTKVNQKKGISQEGSSESKFPYPQQTFSRLIFPTMEENPNDWTRTGCSAHLPFRGVHCDPLWKLDHPQNKAWPIIHIFSGLRKFWKHGTFSFNIGKPRRSWWP